MGNRFNLNIVATLKGNKMPKLFNGREVLFYDDGSTSNLNMLKVGDPIYVYDYSKLFELIHKNHYENFKITNKDLENIVIKTVVSNKTYTIKEIGVKESILICEPHVEVFVNNEKYDIISNETIMGSQRIGYILNSYLPSSLNVLNRNSEELTTKQYLQKLNNLKKVAEFFLSHKTNLLERINTSIEKVGKEE